MTTSREHKAISNVIHNELNLLPSKEEIMNTANKIIYDKIREGITNWSRGLDGGIMGFISGLLWGNLYKQRQLEEYMKNEIRSAIKELVEKEFQNNFKKMIKITLVENE